MIKNKNKKIKRFFAMFGALLFLACACLPLFASAFSITELSEYNYFNPEKITHPTPSANNSGTLLTYVSDADIDTGTITLKTPCDYRGSGYVPAQFTNVTLGELCPDMVAGETYYLSVEYKDTSLITSQVKTVQESLYLTGVGHWKYNTARTITEDDLSAKVQLYGFVFKDGAYPLSECELTLKMWINKGDVPQKFVSYGMKEYFDMYRQDAYEQAKDDIYQEAYEAGLQNRHVDIFNGAIVSAKVWYRYLDSSTIRSYVIDGSTFDHTVSDGVIDVNPTEVSTGIRDLPYLINKFINDEYMKEEVSFEHVYNELVITFAHPVDIGLYTFELEKYVYNAFAHSALITVYDHTGYYYQASYSIVDRLKFNVPAPETFLATSISIRTSEGDQWDFSGTALTVYSGSYDLYKNAYKEGYDSATILEGALKYQEGYADGKEVGLRDGYDIGFSEGDAVGEKYGETIGYDKGYTEGEKDGRLTGETIGYDKGYTEGEKDGRVTGETLGYNKGYDVGYTDGETKGYVKGETEGYTNGYTEGEKDGRLTGETIGYNKGFDVGYNDGSDGSSWFNLFSGVVSAPITALTSLFNFEIFGVNMAGFVSSLVTICVVLAVVRFVI